MQNSDRKKDNKKLDRQYKILAKNTFYQIFNRYGTYIFSLISSFLLARMISQELWGFLIITTSILGIFTLIISFIPPGLIYSLNYYIPHYRAQNKMKIVRSFILKTFYIRIIVVMCVYIISLCLFLFFTDIFAINLKNYIFLLYILSPIIVIESLHTFLIAVMYGFNLFKSVFILLLIRNFVSISLLLSYFIFIGTIDIEVVAFINLFSSLIPFLVSTFIVALKMIKINVTPENGLNFKEVFEKTLKYGGLLSIQTIASGLWAQSEIQVIGLFEPPEWVTGYSISSHYSSVNGLFLSSLSYPLQYTLSSLDYKENFSKIVKIYKVVFNFSLFFLALITGILFFFVDFFFSFFYGDTYLIYSTLAKLMVISPVFGVLYNLYFSFLRATNQVKLTLMIFSITFSLSISLFWIGLINFGIIGAVFGL
ncbi:MAG: oligosaccharide flippase family protein, partial [Candidatus Lokiarchaeota archaeon]|nr:oligosaccharide flippase family protein [Candidatus Lokiarchaeota archaeon]